MKTGSKRNILNRIKFLLLQFLSCSCILAYVIDIQAKEEKGKKTINDSLSKTLIFPHYMSFDGNRIYTTLSNLGHTAAGGQDRYLFWPSVPRTSRDQDGKKELRGDIWADYSSGLWVAGIINGEIRTAICSWQSEYIPGKILPDGTRDNSGLEKYRVYKIMKGDGPGIKDWDEWPIEDGAPVNEDGTPKLIGDQTLWFVMNDLEETRHQVPITGTLPIGIEVQATVFGFNESGPLGDIMFVEYKIINKGTADLDSAFVGFWSDSDLGYSADDLVGSDSSLGLSFYYNGTPRDPQFGTNTPAIGFDFFRGPEVPVGSGNYLKMTSFIKYTWGAPAGREDPVNAEEVYNFMKGYWGDGSQIINQITGKVTKFVHSGDPVTGTGDLDYSPMDRRSLMSSGPFTLAVGDTQMISGARIIAPGVDPPSSVAALRFFDKFAQGAFDNNFDIMRSPQIENLDIRCLDQEIFLSWFDDAEYIEPFEKLGYKFQGYIVYQGESAGGPWKRIAVYDLKDGVQNVIDEQFDSNIGMIVSSPVILATDSGLQRYVRITEDAIFNPNQRLSNYRDYYFAVTTYSVNLDGVPKMVESAIVSQTVSPTATDFGINITENFGNVDSLEHNNGNADGTFFTNVVDPTLVPNANYRISFNEDHSISVDKNGSFYTTFPEFDPTGVSNYTDLDNAPVVDGLQIHLVATFDAPITFMGDEFTTDADTSDGDLVFWGDNMNWGAPTGLYNNFVTPPSADILGRDLQFHFTGLSIIGDDDNDTTITQGGQWTTQWPRAAWGQPDLSTIPHVQIRTPFELWDIENNRQINFAVINRNADGGSPYGSAIGDPNTPGMEPRWRITGRDYIVPIMTEYDPTTADTTVFSLNDSNATWVLFFVQSGGAVWSYGDVYTVFYKNPLIPGIDEFALPTTQGMVSGQEMIKKEQLKKINIVPNPYWAHNSGERHPINRFIRLTNLPGSGVTIRIFTLAGELVKVINDSKREEDGTFGLQYANWDLRNDAGIPVASGVYLVHFEVKGVGNIVRKAAVILPEERLRF